MNWGLGQCCRQVEVEEVVIIALHIYLKSLGETCYNIWQFVVDLIIFNIKQRTSVSLYKISLVGLEQNKRRYP